MVTVRLQIPRKRRIGEEGTVELEEMTQLAFPFFQPTTLLAAGCCCSSSSITNNIWTAPKYPGSDEEKGRKQKMIHNKIITSFCAEPSGKREKAKVFLT